ncbi:(GlcNAc)2 ABC transporter permease component 2 [Vibrio maritimus]|uniref:(GlcNAc)2 ABC transporter permease component 2 n=1 Tax=Vibrio maritimus TaxID=990268 RepID=A0A090T1M2_9VIBR|nr:(GlcNAc)2 ABC transporter permease component 2 [Vibrio maritimus]
MKGFLQLVWRNGTARLGLSIIGLFVFVAVAAPLITKHAPDKRTGNSHEYLVSSLKWLSLTRMVGLPPISPMIAVLY